MSETLDLRDTRTAPKALRGHYVLPASLGQQRLHFLGEFNANAGRAYQVNLAYRIDGAVDRVALQCAVNHVVARHEALRTRVLRLDGELVQVVDPNGRLTVRLVDVGADGGGAHALGAFVDAHCRRIIRPDADHLAQIALLRGADGDAGLLVRFSHLIVDATSLEVFIDELERCYDSFSRGEDPRLPPVPLQYADYVVWQQRWLTSDQCRASRQYWQQTLARAPLVLELPADAPRPAQQAFEGRLLRVPLAPDLVAAVRQLAHDRQTTTSTVLLSAFVALLGRYTGKTDFLIGMPVENRPAKELERVMGFFANTVVIRADLSQNPTLADILDRVRTSVVEALAHQQLPFAELVKDLRPDRSFSGNPIFQVMYVYRRSPALRCSGGSLGLSRLPIDNGTSKFDLTLMLADDGDGIEAQLEYDVTLFATSPMQRLLGYYLVVLRALLGDPAQRLAGVTLLTAAERTRLLATSRDGGERATESTVVDLLERTVAAHSGRLALMYADEGWTYAELNADANRIAAALRQAGVRPGDRVAVLLGRSLRLLPALFGILKTGAAYVPLDPRDPAERNAAIMADAAPAACVWDRTVEHTGVTAPIVVDLDAQQLSDFSADDVPVRIPGEAPAYVIYTSGSTGEPKGAVIPHRALSTLLLGLASVTGIRASDVFVAPNTIAFDISVPELYLPAVVGACTVVASRADSVDSYALRDLIVRRGATVMEATPSYWRMLLETGWSPKPGFKVLCGGEALSEDLRRRLTEGGGECWNLYGPTEATVWSCYKRLTPDETLTIGRPFAHTGAYVLDESYSLVPITCCGELFLTGAHLAHGYLNRPAQTAERFVPDPYSPTPGARMYRTGDLVRYLENGELQFVGRTDQQVKIRGFRVELGEIEATVCRHPGVQDAVAGVVGTDEYRALLLFLVPASDASLPGKYEEITLLPPSIRALMRRTLPDHMVPTWFVKLHEFPVTPRGKIDRQALTSRTYQRAENHDAYMAPRDDIEARLAQIWADVLRYERVGVYDNFFDLGGNSLLIGYVIERINQQCGIRVPMRELFLDATAAYVAEYVRNELRERAHATPAPDTEERPELHDMLLDELTPEELAALASDPSLSHEGVTDADTRERI